MKLHKILVPAVALLASADLFSQAIITGIIDGPRTGGLPKGIEIYITQDIADLSLLGIESGTNGAAFAAREFSLTGSAVAGTFITIASESTGWSAYFGVAPTFTDGSMNINGNDPVYLWYNSGSDSVIDAFGNATNPAVDTGYNYQDTWWYRLDETTGSATWSAVDWFFATGQSDALDSLGTSGVNPASPSALHMPLGSYTPAAVPEPSAYAVIFGVVALGGVAAKRRRRV
jgi:hypothetical protein